MAPSKRKRNSTRSKANKRPKYVDSSDSQRNSNQNQTWWAAECILDEEDREGVPYYHVKWKGIDNKTGRKWDPSWEPVGNVTADLVASWEQEKKAQIGTPSTGGNAESRRSSRRPERQQTTPQQTAQHLSRRSRRPLVLDSSSEPSTAHSSTLPSEPSSPASPERASPHIPIPRRGPSLGREEFDTYSQLPTSRSASAQLQTQETDLDSSQLFAATRPFSSGIVPDSQSSASEASFVPATQQTADTNPQSTVTTGSQEEEVEVTEDSGLLDIIQEAASRAISPARSIPETLSDIAADSQSQHQRAGPEEPRDNLEVFEVVESSSQAVLAVTEDEGQNSGHGDEREVFAESESQRLDDEHATQQDSAVPHSVGGASQPNQENLLQLVAYSDTQQGQDGQLSQEQATSLEIAEGTLQAVSDTAEEDVQVVLDDTPAIAKGEFQEEQPQEEQLQEATTFTTSADDIISGVTYQQIGLGNNQASLTEQAVLEEHAQFPFHSQHPLQYTSPSQVASPVIGQENSESGVQDIASTEVVDSEAAVAHSNEAPVQGSSESFIVPDSSQSASRELQQAEAEPSSYFRGQDDDLLDEFLEPEYTRSSSPVARQGRRIEAQATDIVALSIHASQPITEGISQRPDFTTHSHSPHPTAQSVESQEENAQVVPVETDLITQEDTAPSIRPTVEKECVPHRASSESRHDSSQETPERQSRSVEHSSSPIPPPPNHFLGTQDSKIPPRPVTPVPTSSLSIMANYDMGEEITRELKERLAKRQAENPFTPKRRMIKSSLTPSATAPAHDGSALSLTSARRMFRTNTSPSAAPEGTRSPSTVPDRSPAPQAPTSLRTVAFAPSSSVPTTLPRDADMTTNIGEQPALADPEVMVTAEEPVLPLEVPLTTEPENEELSDVDDDDTESLLKDDLNLKREEYIVPLFIEGRQVSMYSSYINYKKDLLEQFLDDPQGFSPLYQVEELLSHLRAVETHLDLVFAEAEFESASSVETNSATQAEFATQFGLENSAKFRFLHWLFRNLRNHDKHIVLVTQKDNYPLFKILEDFCKVKLINYSMPTRGRQANPTHVEGNLLVTIFPCDASPIIRAPDVIICLDGVQEATHIRQQNWARSSEQEFVPVLHLVVPRTVGHIERYISPALDVRERIHITLASLAHMREELGRPFDKDTPRALVAATKVSEWLTADGNVERLKWPLPSIGSVKAVIEYQTSSPAPERAKRRLDDEDVDLAKRMRFTPQPQSLPSSSLNNDEAEITHISDSMPGTLTDAATLGRQLARTDEAYQKERTRRKAEEQRFREHEVMWDKQQTEHENLTREYRRLLGAQKTAEEKLETVTKNNETLRERLTNRTTEMRQLTDQLEEQRATHLLSSDDQIVAITLLRKELAAAQEEKQRAIKSAQTAESMLEYTKEQYRLAQDAATSSQSAIDQLTSENAKLALTASGQPAKLKDLHRERQHENQEKQLKALKAENGILKTTLGLKEEELARARNNVGRNTVGRVGVGTRAQSVTPQPRVRSRAASPMRLSNLRNG